MRSVTRLKHRKDQNLSRYPDTQGHDSPAKVRAQSCPPPHRRRHFTPPQDAAGLRAGHERGPCCEPSTRTSVAQTRGVMLTAGSPLWSCVPAPSLGSSDAALDWLTGHKHAEPPRDREEPQAPPGSSPASPKEASVRDWTRGGASPTAVHVGGTCLPAVTPLQT